MINFYTDMFHQEGEKIISSFCKLAVPRNVFLSKYNQLPEKLDNMDEASKKELKLYVNDLFKNETPQFRLDACKIIFTLNSCL